MSCNSLIQLKELKKKKKKLKKTNLYERKKN